MAKLSRTTIDLLDVHGALTGGVIYTDVTKTDRAYYFWSNVPGEYYSFAVASSAFDAEQLAELEAEFVSRNRMPSIAVFQSFWQSGMVESLVRRGYTVAGEEVWLVAESGAKADGDTKCDLRQVDASTFSDFATVLGDVFGDWPGNDAYLDLCRQTATGDLKASIPDFASTFYVVYESGIPVAGAAMMYSISMAAAYLHNAGTISSARGKGYQTALVNHRLRTAREAGVDRVYSAVTPGSQSWANIIRCGFAQTEPFMLLVKKPVDAHSSLGV